jgi:malonyl-CoA decarboxylase
MTPNAQSLSGLSNATPAPVDRAKQLAATLLSERGEASGAQVARELHQMLRLLDASDRHRFQRYLASEFQPDKAALRTAAERYLADPRQKARPRSRRLPIHPGRRCCDA